MKIKQLDQLAAEGREVSGETWTSRRLLLRSDGMGFSMHDTIIHGGTTTEMHYKNHLEAVYCIEGKGSIEDLGTGETHAIVPGTLYALDAHDHHILRAEETLRLICVFNPALVGPETHGDDLAYPLLDDDGNPVG